MLNNQIFQIVLKIIILIVFAVIYYLSIRTELVQERHKLAVEMILGRSRMSLISKYLIKALLFVTLLGLPFYCLTLIVIGGIVSSVPCMASIMVINGLYSFIGVGVLYGLVIAITSFATFIQLKKRSILLMKDKS